MTTIVRKTRQGIESKLASLTSPFFLLLFFLLFFLICCFKKTHQATLNVDSNSVGFSCLVSSSLSSSPSISFSFPSLAKKNSWVYIASSFFFHIFFFALFYFICHHQATLDVENILGDLFRFISIGDLVSIYIFLHYRLLHLLYPLL